MVATGGIEVTVVLPTRDRWSQTEVALASALSQQEVAVEVCVVDDGSRTAAPSGFDADPRVRVFRHARPRGVAASRNRAIKEARGEWIAFLDDDDVWAPWHLRMLLNAARGQQARWAFSGYVMTDLERAPVGNGPVPWVEENFERQFLRCNPIGTPSAMLVATETVRAIGGFDERMSVMADWDLWVRLSASWRPAVSSSFSVGYAQHEGNMSLDMDLVLAEWNYMAARHRAALRRLDLVFADDEHFWRWVGKGYDRQHRRMPAARFYLRAAIKGRHGRDAVRAIGMVPIVGWPVLIRRRVIAARASRRARHHRTPSPEHVWLRAHDDAIIGASLQRARPHRSTLTSRRLRGRSWAWIERQFRSGGRA